MGKLWPWFVMMCGLVLVSGTTESTDQAENDQFSLMGEVPNEGVWRFTCDEYCYYCGCVGQFLHDKNKCVCSCEPGAADWDCLEDVKQTKEFLGLNYTLEVRENESNPVEDTAESNVRVQREIDPPPRRRPMGRRNPRPSRGEPRVSPNPERPNRRRRERRPFRRREPLAPTDP